MLPVTATISRAYVVQASHSLPNVPPGHKCGRCHGHTYEIVVALTGRCEPTLGWVMDFAMLDAIVNTSIVAVLDHHHLNDIDGLENPTSEVLAWWIWKRLASTSLPTGVELSRVEIGENDRSRVVLCGDTPDRNGPIDSGTGERTW